MPLQIGKPQDFTTAVELLLPGDAESAKLQVTWRHKSRTQVKVWMDAGKSAASDAAFLAEVVADWSGVVGADGQPLPYSLQALGQLLDQFPSAADQLFDAYLAALFKAREKN